jgi:hypothetical protein
LVQSDWVYTYTNLLQASGCRPSQSESKLESVVIRSTEGAGRALFSATGSSVDERTEGGSLGMMWISVVSHKRMASGG